MSVEPDLNSGRVSQPGGVALPVLSLAGAQDEAAAEPVMDVGVLIEPTPEPEPEVDEATALSDFHEVPELDSETPAPKKRGRPRKVVVDEPVTVEEVKED